MSIESRTKMYGDIFSNWMISERIGSGSGGVPSFLGCREKARVADLSGGRRVKGRKCY